MGDLDQHVPGPDSFEHLNNKINAELDNLEQYSNPEEGKDSSTISEQTLGVENAKESEQHVPLRIDEPSHPVGVDFEQNPIATGEYTSAQFPDNNAYHPGLYGQQGHEYNVNTQYQGVEPPSSYGQQQFQGHFDHSHIPNGHFENHGHGQTHGHHENLHHENLHHPGHYHTQDPSHNHGHSHDHRLSDGHAHSHGHGHSHDHGDDHDHSHGIGHLGKSAHNKAPQEIPTHYKPAAQDYELPLSAQFGTPSPYTYKYSEPSTATEPPPAYEEENQINAGFEENLVAETNNMAKDDNVQLDPILNDNKMELNEAVGEVQNENDIPPQIVEEPPFEDNLNLNKDENEVVSSPEEWIPEDEKVTHSDPTFQKSSIIPEWMQEQAHETGGFNGDRIALVIIISITILLIYLINTFMDQNTREKPLIRRLAEMDKKLFKATNELLILRNEKSESDGNSRKEDSSDSIREIELELQQAREELENSREGLKKEGERSNIANIRLEEAQQEVLNAQEEARQAQEMLEEVLANQKDQNMESGSDKLVEVVHQLQSQLESQKDMLVKYEPKLKKKEKENKELMKQMKQMKADVANANLETDKLKKELS